MLRLRLPGAQSNRQRAANWPHTAIERQLANGKNVRQMLSISEVAIRSENPERNWQIKTGAFFPHIGWRQIDRRLVNRKEKRAVVDGGANSFARFPDGEIG